MRRLLQAVLGRPEIYNLSQRVIGAARVRNQCIAALDVRGGMRVLDVGCGPAYYFGRLPAGVEYHGFDTAPHYLTWARTQFPAAHFHDGIYRETDRAALGPFDRVLLLGLLHHLDDDEAHGLLDLVARSLAPNGRAVALDTTAGGEVSGLESALARQDRGRFVRTAAAFRELASAHFDDVTGQLVGAPPVPFPHWQMLLRSPLRTGATRAPTAPPP